MGQSKRTGQQGAVQLIAVLIGALVVAIGFAIWAWNKNAKAEKCLKTLEGPIMTYNNQWQASKVNGSPDAGICRQLNTFIQQYNKSCGADYGTLPLENCG